MKKMDAAQNQNLTTCHQLVDDFGRAVNYLRVSVTDRCNLRCRYCMTGKTQWLPKGQILTLEEIFRLIEIAMGLGFSKIRLTGGEPLCRRGITDLIARICRLEGLEDLALTTNGTLFAEKAVQLKDAGLRRVNISLDTLDPVVFKQLTGVDDLEKVWRGILVAAELGFHPVKINTVVMRGSNDDQIEAMAELARRYPFHVRFIEYMPIAVAPQEVENRFVSIAEIEARLRRMGKLTEIAPQKVDGPARRLRFEDAPGEIGLIGSMSAHFCGRCNRMRLTADGHLRPCLLSEDQVDIITPLRAGASDAELSALFSAALARKQASHQISFGGCRTLRTRMVRIGG